MFDPDSPSKKNQNKLREYNSPSRLSVVTPVKNALRESNNNPYIFLDQLNKFKKGIAKLDLQRSKKDGIENDNPSTL